MIYLASPYTHRDARIMQSRYESALRFTADRIRAGYAIFSPIVHCHEMALAYNMPKDFAFWQTYNEALLRQSLALWVLTLGGWETSAGVTGEITFAMKYRIRTEYMNPDGTTYQN